MNYASVYSDINWIDLVEDSVKERMACPRLRGAEKILRKLLLSKVIGKEEAAGS